MNDELIAQKVAAGLTRGQAIEVIARQEAEDAAAVAAETAAEERVARKTAKKAAKAAEQPPAE